MARTVSRAGVRMVLKGLWIEDITFCPDFPNSSQTWCGKPHTDSTNQNLEPYSKASKVIEVWQEAGLYQDWPKLLQGDSGHPNPKSGPTAVRGQLQGPWISTIPRQFLPVISSLPWCSQWVPMATPGGSRPVAK